MSNYLVGYLASHIARTEGIVELEAMAEHIEAEPTGYPAFDELHATSAVKLREVIATIRADGHYPEVVTGRREPTNAQDTSIAQALRIIDHNVRQAHEHGEVGIADDLDAIYHGLRGVAIADGFTLDEVAP